MEFTKQESDAPKEEKTDISKQENDAPKEEKTDISKQENDAPKEEKTEISKQENDERTPEEKIKDLTMAIDREVFAVSQLRAAIATTKNLIRLLELPVEPKKDTIAAIKEHVRGLEENLRLTVEKTNLLWGMRHEEHAKAGTCEEWVYDRLSI
jgi:chromosome segregation ATPase